MPPAHSFLKQAVRVTPTFPLAEAILLAHAPALGPDFPAYRNHVCRVLNFFEALAGAPPSEAVLVAAAFHDLGIWTDRTFDYLEPSIREARGYLDERGQEAAGPEVAAIIAQHHKLRPYGGAFAPTVERFHQADLVDLSLGAIGFGLPTALVRAVRAAFPNQGFHGLLTRLSARQFLRTPWRPLPMVRW